MKKHFRLSALRAASLVVVAPMLSCSTQQIMNVALAKDPSAALKSFEQSKLATYRSNPQALVNDVKRLNDELSRLFGNLRQESNKKWGKEESETLPSPKRYVKYTEQYKNRIIVNYDTGQILIEHIQEPGAADKLRGAIVVALLTPENPRSADVFTDKDVVLDGKPFLQDLVLDQNKQPMKSRADVERFAEYLITNRTRTRAISANGARVLVLYVEMEMIGAEQDRAAASQPPKRPPKAPPKPGGPPLPPNLQPDPKADERPDPNQYAAADRIAPKFLDMVNRHAQATGVDPALVFGIIYQESRFNPNAVSQAEAYGMMQLVPKSGGLEAFRKAKGGSVEPTKEYLMDPENNIELGSTYLGMILFDYWTKNVANLPSREYCTISAYNTGPGNVARAFAGSPKNVTEAQERANGMRPDELFDYLRGNLPYAETRDYLLRVSAARRHYHELFYADAR